ncbi:hypothetical protein BDW59DRAFT_35962 [Aspergillus cavernicola]|uniref:Uncharacterized protein n=1 Tax=Aspergillus cavernicola TaxID=176166 RepID=A0ABR4INW1_9EURO
MALVTSEWMSTLVISLPSTVHSLKIVRMGIYTSSTLCELCSSIQVVLPRLKRLRLLMPWMCMGILSSVADTSKRLLSG